mmetsp:Transcript_58596/g.188349  ORF Transcript_58596/g.188349 Transcript_58596/m.188349 type:complete len:203 (-) Transcript_58596:525-1133(-)
MPLNLNPGLHGLHAVARALPARVGVGVVEAPPVLVEVPGLLRGDAEPVPLRERALVARGHGAGRVQGPHGLRQVLEEEQVAFPRHKLQLFLAGGRREDGGAALQGRLAVHERRGYSGAEAAAGAIRVRLVLEAAEVVQEVQGLLALVWHLLAQHLRGKVEHLHGGEAQVVRHVPVDEEVRRERLARVAREGRAAARAQVRAH